MEKTCRGECMTFTYTKITNTYYLSDTDEWEEDGIEFTYEPTYQQLKQEVKELITRDYGESSWSMIDELDLVECVAQFYEDELKDIFEKEAMEWYND